MTTDSTLAPPPLSTQHGGPARPAGVRAALHATRGALQWRLLLWWALLLLLPTLAATLPLWQLLSASLDHSVHAARLAERLDMIAFSDLVVTLRERYAPAAGAGGGVGLVLALLLSPLLSGMAIAASRTVQPLRAGALLAAGAHEYLRLARMLVWSAIPLGAAAIVAGLAWRAAGHTAATALLEADADRAEQLAPLATGALLLLAHATVDVGRAVLAADRRRTSAIIAWADGCRLLLRRPLALLGTYLAVTAAGLLLAALVAFARVHVPALGTAGTVGAVALAQLAVVVLGWMRAARLFALAVLVR